MGRKQMSSGFLTAQARFYCAQSQEQPKDESDKKQSNENSKKDKQKHEEFVKQGKFSASS